MMNDMMDNGTDHPVVIVLVLGAAALIRYQFRGD
ncbi:hypothetical protein ABIC10_009352 [Bradyrhizobium sp. S3.2.12]